MCYSGGKVTHVDWMNGEEISFVDLEGIVYDLGYKEMMGLHYKYSGSQTFRQILSNQEIVEIFGVFRRIRTVNIYICDVNPIALKVVHLGEEENSDVNEDSQYYEFNEEDEEMVPTEEEEEEMAQTEEQEEMVQTESNLVPRITFIQPLPTLIEPQNEQEEKMVQTESNTETHPPCSQSQNEAENVMHDSEFEESDKEEEYMPRRMNDPTTG